MAISDIPQLELEKIVSLGTPEQQKEHGVYHEAFSDDGCRSATHLHDGGIGIWDTSTGSLISRLPTEECIKRCTSREVESHYLALPTAIALNHDGSLAVIGFKSNDAFLVEVANGRIIRSFQRPPDIYPDEYDELYSHYAGGSPGVHRITFSQDGTLIAIVYDYRLVGVWRVDDESQVARLQPSYAAKSTTFFGGLAQTVRFSEDNRYLFVAELGGVVAIWELATGELVLDGSHHVDSVISIDESNGRVRWATQTGHVWEATDTQAPILLVDADANWRDALFTLDGNHVIATIRTQYVGNDLHAYRFSSNTTLDAFSENEATRHALETLNHHRQTDAIRPDFNILLPHPHDRISNFYNRYIKVRWTENEQVFVGVLYVDRQQRKLLQICEGDNKLRIWDFQTMAFLQEVMLENPCEALAFSPDGEFLAVLERNRSTHTTMISLWNTSDWACINRISPDENPASYFSEPMFSADSKWLLYKSSDCVISFRSISGDATHDIPGLACQPLSDGRFVVLTTHFTFQIWQGSIKCTPLSIQLSA